MSVDSSTRVWPSLLTLAAAMAVARAFQFLPATSRTTRMISSKALLLSPASAGRRCDRAHYNASYLSSPLGRSAIRNGRTSQHYCPLSRPMSQTASSESTASSSLSEEQKAELESKIKEKGDTIRSMKEKGLSKEELAPHVAELLELKSRLDPSSASPTPKEKGDDRGKRKEEKDSDDGAATSIEAESDFITPRSENYSKWYNDIIRVCDLAEPSPVRGCMVIKPWGMSLWDQIRNDLDERIKKHGAENAYFPLLIPKSFLSKEAEHVDGFAKECAVVTHHRLTVDPNNEKGLIADPEAELEDPLIIRPTSETMIWNMFKKWIVSHR